MWLLQLRVIVVLLFVVVEVLDTTFTNVALKKPSAQVNDLHDRAESHLANDGSLNPDFRQQACTHTRTTSNTWWMVDLIHDYDVHTIRILNRISDEARLTDFYIYVSNVKPLSIPTSHGSFTGELCLHHPDMLPKNGIQTLHCTQKIRGRYVYIWKPANNVLTLCEFEVLVDFQSRQTTCTFLPEGKKCSNVPVYSEVMDSISFTNCLLTCASAPEREANIVQINKATRMCECIQISSFNDQNNAIIQHSDYDLCVITHMINRD